MARSGPEGVEPPKVHWGPDTPLTTAMRGSVREVVRHIDPWETVISFAVSDLDLRIANVRPEEQLPRGTEMVMTTLALWRDRMQHIETLENTCKELHSRMEHMEKVEVKVSTVDLDPDVNVFNLSNMVIENTSGYSGGVLSLRAELDSVGPFDLSKMAPGHGSPHAPRYKLVPID